MDTYLNSSSPFVLRNDSPSDRFIELALKNHNDENTNYEKLETLDNYDSDNSIEYFEHTNAAQLALGNEQDIEIGDQSNTVELDQILHEVSIIKAQFSQMINTIDCVANGHPKNEIVENEVFDPMITSILDIVKTLAAPNSSELSHPNKYMDIKPLDDPCAHLPNYGVILCKSPSSSSQLWDEYTKVPNELGVKDLMMCVLNIKKDLEYNNNQSVQDFELILKRTTSIQRLEKLLGSSWRNKDKNFSRQINRRKKIWNSIEEGLKDGLTLEQCFCILDSYMHSINKGLSIYYNGVPFRLVDMQSLLHE